jgi:hypothetical protein
VEAKPALPESVTVADPDNMATESCTMCTAVCCVPETLYVVGTVVRFETGVVLETTNGDVPAAKVEVNCVLVPMGTFSMAGLPNSMSQLVAPALGILLM